MGLDLDDEYTTGSSPRVWRPAISCRTGSEKAGFEVHRPAGTYFVMADARPLGFDDGEALCRSLPERCGVVAVPAAAFYVHPDRGRHLLRFAFCKRDEVLHEAVDPVGRAAGQHGVEQPQARERQLAVCAGSGAEPREGRL